MTRLAPLDPPYPPNVQDALTRLMGDRGAEPLKLFRTIAHHDALLDRFRQIGSSLLSFGRLPADEREIVIQRTTALCGAAYEWGVHAAIFAAEAGIDADALWAGRDDGFDRRQALLIRLCDELHATATVSDELWEQLRAGWPDDQLVELVCLAGFYHLVSFACNAFDVEPEVWAARPPVAASTRDEAARPPVAASTRDEARHPPT
jgi:4-carboxymuconolactone decarboxylase